MKNLWIIALALAFTFSMTACGQSEEQEMDNSSLGEQASVPETGSDTETEEGTDAEAETDAGAGAEDGAALTPVTLTIGDTVLEAYLNDSAPAQSLAAQLPLTVSLNDSDNDFCGDNLDIEYSDEDVTSGYENGDLVFWTPANNFVIFVSGEESAAGTGNLVKLGRITSPQEMLDALEGQIDVTIALKEDGMEAGSTGTETTETESTGFEEPEADSGLETSENADDTETAANEQEGAETMQIKITVGDTELFANLEDNATTRAWMEEMPMTLSMSDLYGREMCYRYGNGTFPTDSLRSDGYEIGDIAYWPPMGSLVILYEQNGEQFERQHIGHIDSGVEIFQSTGDTDVTFEVVN